MESLQKQCDRLTQAVLWRRSRQSEKPELYLVEFSRRGEVGIAIVAHDTPCDRAVICGGNAGMSYPDTFRGVRGATFEVRGCARSIFRLDGWDSGTIKTRSRTHF